MKISLRGLILDRDHHICQECGKAENLQIHHIIPQRCGGLDEEDNLITLCVLCHVKEEFKLKPKSGNMKITKSINRIVGDTKYYKYIVTIPCKYLKQMGWSEKTGLSMRLEPKSEPKRLIIERD